MRNCIRSKYAPWLLSPSTFALSKWQQKHMSMKENSKDGSVPPSFKLPKCKLWVKCTHCNSHPSTPNSIHHRQPLVIRIASSDREIEILRYKDEQMIENHMWFRKNTTMKNRHKQQKNTTPENQRYNNRRNFKIRTLVTAKKVEKIKKQPEIRNV